MKEIYGDFWIHFDEYKDQYNAIVCTTNTIVKADGTLVMGAGIAKEFAKEFPFLPKEWGRRVKQRGLGLIVTPLKNGLNLVGFPTKTDWKQPATIELVEASLDELLTVTNIFGWKKVLMPRPGCRNGGLDWHKEIRPLMVDEFELDERFVVINNGT